MIFPSFKRLPVTLHIFLAVMVAGGASTLIEDVTDEGNPRLRGGGRDIEISMWNDQQEVRTIARVVPMMIQFDASNHFFVPFSFRLRRLVAAMTSRQSRLTTPDASATLTTCLRTWL